MTTSFMVDDLTVYRIIEREGLSLPARDMFPDLTPELLAENRSWMRPTALTSEDILILCCQSYVVRTPHHTILIDTCIGNDKQLPQYPTWHMQTSDSYMRGLAVHGLTVDDIDYVVCTHLHIDHVGWNTRLENGRWIPTFPKARYLFTKQEYDFWSAENDKERRNSFVESVLPIVEANRADLVSNTHQLGDHVRFLPTPGHTPDHVAICLGRGHDHVVILGDLMHSPLQMRYPDISPYFEHDKAQSNASRRDLLARYCETSTLCCTIHFPSPSVGRIKHWGDGFRLETN